MKFQKYGVTAILICILGIMSANCGRPNSSSTNPIINNPQLVGDTYIVFEKQIERVNNCDGAMPVYTISRSLEKENTTFFTVELEAGPVVKGTPIPEVLSVELEAKIKAAIGNSVSDTYSQAKSLPVNTERGHFVEHEIIWKETRVKGIVEAIYPEGIARLGFEKIIGIELYDRISREIGCASGNVSAPIITTSPTDDKIIPESVEPNPTNLVTLFENYHCQYGDSAPADQTIHEQFSVILQEGEFINGQSTEFKQGSFKAVGGVAYLLKGPGQFNWSTMHGWWEICRNGSNENATEKLNFQAMSLESHGNTATGYAKRVICESINSSMNCANQ